VLEKAALRSTAALAPRAAAPAGHRGMAALAV